MSDDIEQRARFDFVRYANCWEDADILLAALDVKPGCRVLSIASAGDNVLALLAAGATVVAADLNPAQLACVELRREAFRQLDYEDVLGFLGIREAAHRVAVYARLASGLSAAARAFWDAHPELVTAGVIHAGKFERYFQTFRSRVMPLIHSRRRVAELLREKDRAARDEFYESSWNNLRWRLLFKLFFSRFMMGRHGRDPEFFRYVEGSVAARILARTRHALTVLSTHDNPYLTYILNGNFGAALPRYLRPAHFADVRASLDRLTLVQGSIQDAARTHAAGGFDGYNLSDIFEYLNPELCRQIYGDLLQQAKPGARLAYWNMLVPRSCPAAFTNRIESLATEAAALLDHDKAFFYSRFVIEIVR